MSASTALIAKFPRCSEINGWSDEVFDQLERDTRHMALSSEQIDAVMSELLRQSRRSSVPGYAEVYGALKRAASDGRRTEGLVWDSEVPSYLLPGERELCGEIAAADAAALCEWLTDTFAYLCSGRMGEGVNFETTRNFWQPDHRGDARPFNEVDVIGDLTVDLRGMGKRERFFRFIMRRARQWRRDQSVTKARRLSK